MQGHLHLFCYNPLSKQQLLPGTMRMLCDFNIFKKSRLAPLLLLVSHQKGHQNNQREEMRGGGREDVE